MIDFSVHGLAAHLAHRHASLTPAQQERPVLEVAAGAGRLAYHLNQDMQLDCSIVVRAALRVPAKQASYLQSSCNCTF